MKESEFSTKLKKPLENEGFLVYKIPDPSSFQAMTSKRPFDWLVVRNGAIHFVELKITHVNNPDKFTIDLKRVAQHQFDSLLALFRQGCENCWVIFGVQSNKTNRILGLYLLRIDDIEKYVIEGELLLKRSSKDLFLFDKGKVSSLIRVWSQYES